MRSDNQKSRGERSLPTEAMSRPGEPRKAIAAVPYGAVVYAPNGLPVLYDVRIATAHS